MDGKRIKAAGAVIERAVLAAHWLNDCGQQVSLATDYSAFVFTVKTSMGSGVGGYEQAMAYMVQACQEMASEIEKRAEALAKADMDEEREAVLEALKDAALTAP